MITVGAIILLFTASSMFGTLSHWKRECLLLNHCMRSALADLDYLQHQWERSLQRESALRDAATTLLADLNHLQQEGELSLQREHELRHLATTLMSFGRNLQLENQLLQQEVIRESVGRPITKH